MSDFAGPPRPRSPADTFAPRLSLAKLPYGAICFAMGLGIAVILPVGANLFLTEALALVLLPFLLKKRSSLFGDRWFKFITLLGLAWLVQQVLVDVGLGQSPSDTIKNWAKIGFLVVNTITLVALLSWYPRRWLSFSVAFFVGYLAHVLTESSIIGSDDLWKFGMGIPTTLLFFALTYRLPMGRNHLIVALGGATLIALNALLGFRSLALVVWLASAFTLAQAVFVGNTIRPDAGGRSFFLVILAALSLSAIGYWAYTEAASAGWLGEAQQGKFLWQAEGEYGLFLNARLETLVSVYGVSQSPLFGYGSNPFDSGLGSYFRQLLMETGRTTDIGFVERGEVATHSFLFEAWVRAGIFGAAYWFAVGALAIDTLRRSFSVPSPFTPLVGLVAFLLIWDIGFSPIAPDRRVLAAFCIAVLLGANRWYREQLAAARGSQ